MNRDSINERLAEIASHGAMAVSAIDLSNTSELKLNPTAADIRNARRWLTTNALTSDDATLGGGLLPTTTAGEIIEIALGESSVMRRVCTVIPGKGINETFAYLNDGQTEGRGMMVGEAPTDRNPAFEGRSSIAHKYTSDRVTAPNELVRDAPGLRAAILSALGRRLGRRQNRAFTFGQGANEPMGLANGCAVGKTSASNTAITIDEMFDLMASLDSEYTSNGQAAFMMNPLILAKLQKLKDAQGLNLWDVSGLADYPIVLNSHMPSTITAGSPVVLYGQYDRAYTIRELETRFITLTETYIENDQTGFEMIQIIDGFVTDFNGVKSLVVHS